MSTEARHDPYGPVIRNGRSYSMARDTDTGLMFVFCDGVKVGQTQTEAGAKLIRRNHARAIERRMGGASEPPAKYTNESFEQYTARTGVEL